MDLASDSGAAGVSFADNWQEDHQRVEPQGQESEAKRFVVKASALQMSSIGKGGRGGAQGNGDGAFNVPALSAVVKVAGEGTDDKNERIVVVDCFNHSLVLLKWGDSPDENK